MEIVGYGLVALAIAVAGGCLLLFVAIWMIRSLLHRTAHKAILSATGIGSDIASSAASRVLEVGEREFTKSFESFKQGLSHNRMVSDPRKMATAVTRLAQKNGGDLSVSNVMAEDESVETVMKRVDKALYQAKASGRNQVVYR